HPFLRRQPRGNPQCETEGPCHGGMESERPVRRGTMQIYGRAEHRDLNQDDGDNEAQDKRKQHSTTLRNDVLGEPARESTRGEVAERNKQFYHGMGTAAHPFLRSKSFMNATSASTPSSGNAL